jgi:hypothetical protein
MTHDTHRDRNGDEVLTSGGLRSNDDPGTWLSFVLDLALVPLLVGCTVLLRSACVAPKGGTPARFR